MDINQGEKKEEKIIHKMEKTALQHSTQKKLKQINTIGRGTNHPKESEKRNLARQLDA